MNRISAFDTINPHRLNATYRGERFMTKRIRIKDFKTKGGVGVEDANDYILKRAIPSFKPNMYYQVAYLLDDDTWVHSRWDGSDSYVPDFAHYGLNLDGKTVKYMKINYVKRPAEAGGTEETNYNNCLYNAIKWAMQSNSHLAQNNKFPANPKKFKDWVGVGEKDLIPASLIKIIEDKIKMCISVKGTKIYNSAKEYPVRILVELKDEHYTFKHNMPHKRTLTSYIGENTRKLCFYQLVEGSNTIITYDGVQLLHRNMERKELGKSREFSYIQSSGDDIVEDFNKYITDCWHLEQMTGIDLAKYEYKIKRASLSIFYDTSRCYSCPLVDDFENEWIKNTSRCGFLYCQPTQGEMNVYDVNSQYPSIMSDKKSTFPIYAPEYAIICDGDHHDFYEYGIYRAEITEYDPRLFFGNRLNHYTHLEMTRAKELGYTIRMIDDGEFNVMYYKTRVTGRHLFGQYMSDLYPHKYEINPETGQTNPLIKKMMNVLWGALAERKRRYYTDSPKNKQPFEVDDLNTGKVKLYERHGKDEIRTEGDHLRGYARLAPFITAYGRVNISRLVEPIVEDVYRIHTDGFYTTRGGLPVSTDLGALKLEKSGNFDIQSLNKISSI